MSEVEAITLIVAMGHASLITINLITIYLVVKGNK